MYKNLIVIIFLAWITLQAFFLQLNKTVVNENDFDNINIINAIKSYSITDIWKAESWILYNLPIAWIDFFINNPLLSWQIFNFLLTIISWIILLALWKKYLHPAYNAILIVIFFISSSFIEYNIWLNSEILYMTLFLVLVISLNKLILESSIKDSDIKVDWIYVKISNIKDIIKHSIFTGFILSLMYFTVNESFIILIWIYFIFLYLVSIDKIDLKTFFASIISLTLSFIILISPFILHFYNLSWELRLTNNINISSQEFWSLDNRTFLEKEKHFFKEKIPQLVLWDSFESYNNKNYILYKNKFVLILLLMPLALFFYWLYKLFFNKIITLTEKRNLLIIISPIFLVNLVFYWTFLSEKSYFIIFIPIVLIIILYWAQNIFISDNELVSSIKLIIILTIFSAIYVQSITYFYTYNVNEQLKYEDKKNMWLWIKDNLDTTDLKIMEYTPVATYYAGLKHRTEIPNVKDEDWLLVYAKLNKIDYMIADLVDFKDKRPNLLFLLEKDYKNNKFPVKYSIIEPGKKVILYKIKY